MKNATIVFVILSFFLSFFFSSCVGMSKKTCKIDKKVNRYKYFGCSPNPLSYAKTALECEKETDNISVSNFALSVIDRSIDNANCIISYVSDIGKLNKMLIISAEFGQIRLVKLLIEKGALINYQEEGTGKTSLFFASINGHKKVVSLLLKNGAEINIKDYDKRTALSYKDDFCSAKPFPNNKKCDKQEIVEFLLKNVKRQLLFPSTTIIFTG